MANFGLLGAGAPLNESTSRTPHDELLLPNGKRVGDVGTELPAMLIALKIPGASHSAGRAANIEAYAAHIHAIREAAADTAVASWLAKKAAMA